MIPVCTNKSKNKDREISNFSIKRKQVGVQKSQIKATDM